MLLLGLPILLRGRVDLDQERAHMSPLTCGMVVLPTVVETEWVAEANMNVMTWLLCVLPTLVLLVCPLSTLLTCLVGLGDGGRARIAGYV